jgi:hypothetical protein
VDFVDDVDLIRALGRGVADRLSEVADLVDAAVGGAVDLEDVEAPALLDLAAELAAVVGVVVDRVEAVDRLGQDPGGRRLADAARAAEEVGVGDALGGDRVAQRRGDVRLADDVLEELGAPLARRDDERVVRVRGAVRRLGLYGLALGN